MLCRMAAVGNAATISGGRNTARMSTAASLCSSAPSNSIAEVRYQLRQLMLMLA